MVRMFPPEGLEFTTALEMGPDRTTIRLAGELDIATRPHLVAAIGEAVATGAANVVIDMRELTFIDSMGISVLIGAVEDGRNNSHVVEFIRGEGPVSRTLRIAGVDTLLPLAA